MQISRTQYDSNARLVHKMNGHIFHVDGTMGHQAIEGIAIVHATPEENSSGYRLMLRIRGKADSIIGKHGPEPGYQYVLTEISGRISELHSIDDDACGISFWTDKIRIIAGENVHESTSSINMPSIVSFSLEMDEVMKECLILIRKLKGQIDAYDGNIDDRELYIVRKEQLERLILQYHSMRAEQETRFLEGCGTGEDVLFF